MQRINQRWGVGFLMLVLLGTMTACTFDKQDESGTSGETTVSIEEEQVLDDAEATETEIAAESSEQAVAVESSAEVEAELDALDELVNGLSEDDFSADGFSQTELEAE